MLNNTNLVLLSYKSEQFVCYLVFTLNEELKILIQNELTELNDFV